MNPHEVNSDIIARLVSGTLGRDEYRAVILALEARPESWRACALAFLEEQALEQELRVLAQSGVDWESYAASHPGPPPAMRPAPDAGRDVAGAGQYRTPRRAVSRTTRLGSLAALLLLGFSLGWMSSSLSSDWLVPPRDPPADVTAGSPRTVPAPTDETMSDKPEATSLASEPGDPATSPSMSKYFPDHHLALADGPMMWLPLDREVPRELRELERAGRIRIESTDGLIPVAYDDGTSVVVPVQQFHVVPVTYAY